MSLILVATVGGVLLERLHGSPPDGRVGIRRGGAMDTRGNGERADHRRVRPTMMPDRGGVPHAEPGLAAPRRAVGPPPGPVRRLAASSRVVTGTGSFCRRGSTTGPRGRTSSARRAPGLLRRPLPGPPGRPPGGRGRLRGRVRRRVADDEPAPAVVAAAVAVDDADDLSGERGCRCMIDG